jgi:hypothetical protein
MPKIRACFCIFDVPLCLLDHVFPPRVGIGSGRLASSRISILTGGAIVVLCRQRPRQIRSQSSSTVNRNLPANNTTTKDLRAQHADEARRRRPRAVAMPRGIVCSPPPRYRLSVCTCAAKVRASLLKARSHCPVAESSPPSFLIFRKTENRSTVASKIFPDGNAHLCRRGRNQRSGTGDFDGTGVAGTTFRCAAGGGQHLYQRLPQISATRP